ncbi:MAG: hypothetical protein HY815_20125 [Candidatus Riflebacteria bacterium]|nr:hypothetical protein [Candidatus Riflebacteria bacterium]
MIIADGRWVVAGGRNLRAEWFSSPADDPHSIRDADVLLRGEKVAESATKAFEDEFSFLKNANVKPLTPEQFTKAVRPLERARQALFDRMTNVRKVPAPAVDAEDPLATAESRDVESDLEQFESMRHYAQFEPYPTTSRWPVVLLGKHSTANPRATTITDALMGLIDSSREEIVIANAYMVLTDRAKAALKAAGQRGVKIRYVTNSPESTGSLITQAWFVKEWKSYLRDTPNLRIFALAIKRKLHGKVFVFDRKVCVVGSYNMDPMSEQINGEDVMVIRSAPFSAECTSWIDDLNRDAVEYRIRVEPDGTVEQVVGPSDHCSFWIMAIMKIIGSLSFLRPVV